MPTDNRGPSRYRTSLKIIFATTKRNTRRNSRTPTVSSSQGINCLSTSQNSTTKVYEGSAIATIGVRNSRIGNQYTGERREVLN